MEASAFHDGTASRSTSPLGVLVAIKPRYGARWSRPGWLDHRQPAHRPAVLRVALRDFGLLLGALTLARLAWSYDTPLKRDRS